MTTWWRENNLIGKRRPKKILLRSLQVKRYRSKKRLRKAYIVELRGCFWKFNQRRRIYRFVLSECRRQVEHGYWTRLAYFLVCRVWPWSNSFIMGSFALANDPRLLGQAPWSEEERRAWLGYRISYIPLAATVYIRWLRSRYVVDWRLRLRPSCTLRVYVYLVPRHWFLQRRHIEHLSSTVDEKHSLWNMIWILLSATWTNTSVHNYILYLKTPFLWGCV